MSETLDVLKDRVRVQLRLANLNCLPLFASLAFLLGDMYLWEPIVPGMGFAFMVMALAVAAVSMILLQRSGGIFERVKKKAQLAELVSAFEPET